MKKCATQYKRYNEIKENKVWYIYDVLQLSAQLMNWVETQGHWYVWVVYFTKYSSQLIN